MTKEDSRFDNNKGPAVVGEFQKISFEQFLKDSNTLDGDKLKEVYDNIAIPVRGTIHSMGHDFVTTKDIHLKQGESTKVFTGIKAKMAPGWGLWIAPRSGLGSKFRMQIDNTVGIIDGDYFDNPGNEGHIVVMITNDGKEGKDLVLKTGDRFVQGVFIPYGITTHDGPLGKRVGGEGSSGL